METGVGDVIRVLEMEGGEGGAGSGGRAVGFKEGGGGDVVLFGEAGEGGAGVGCAVM